MFWQTFNAEQVRAITFLGQEEHGPPQGQQMRCWLPAGTYQVIGKETIKITEFGKVQEIPNSIRLVKPKSTGGTVYYVSIGSIDANIYIQLPQLS